MTWLSIDGGNEAKANRICYCARWHGLCLDGIETWGVDGARLTRPALDFYEAPTHVVVERHQQDGRISGGGGRVPPGVIIDLAWNTAAVAYTLARGAPVYEHTPTVWIGSISKPALHLRIWAALTAGERVIVAGYHNLTVDNFTKMLRKAAAHYAKTGRVTKHCAYNTLDAIGVGLFHLGRVGKGAAPVRRSR